MKAITRVPGARARITAPVELPDVVTVGLTHEFTDRITGKAGFEWSHWSKFSSFPVTNSGTGGPLLSGIAAGAPVVLNFRYDDGYYFSLGGDYKYNQNLTLRAGVAYEITPISDASRSIRLPDNDRFWVNIGASYAINEKLSLDVAYSHAFVGSTPINLAPGNPSYSAGLPVLLGKADSSVDIVSVGFRYAFGDTAKKELPIVRKF